METFAEAFGRDDFPTVYMVLDAEAQFRFEQNLNLLQCDGFIGPGAVDECRDWLKSQFSLETVEPITELYLFDRLMLIADGADDFLIDLSGDVEIGTVETGNAVATVAAVVDGIAGNVRFRLTETLAGRWRVNQFTLPGGDEEKILWSVPQRPTVSGPRSQPGDTAHFGLAA